MRLLKQSIILFLVFFQVGLIFSTVQAESPYVPEQLRPWVEWVTDQRSELRCASINSLSSCLWPGRIEIEASRSGAHFKIFVHSDDDSELVLPGSDLAHAYNVDIKTLSAKGAGYLSSNDVPSVQLERGDYEISASLSWAELPETLNLPPQVGLVRLTRDGKLIERPHLEGNTIWLGGASEKPVREADALAITSVRNVSDGAPFVISTALHLRVAGSARQLVVPAFLPQGFVITAVETELPYQMTPQGALSLQISAGEHTVTITSQSASAPSSVSFPKVDLPQWPAQEYVSWRPDPAFRTVAISGGVLTDASRTELPPEWQQGSIYALKAGEAITLTEQARGEQESPPTQISLQRNVWLHDDGSGFTATDMLQGFAAAPWRLDLSKDFKLGQASTNGVPQVITSNPTGGMSGVELRSTNLNLTSTFVSGQSSHIPANGWTHELESSQVSLHLPAGWKVIAALGADSASNTIVGRWSLIDLLITAVLVVVSALLFGVYGAIALAMVLLVFHGGASELRSAWIGLSIGCLGLKYLPPGRLRLLARIYTSMVVLCLLLLLPSILAQLSELLVASTGSGLPKLVLRGPAELAYALLEESPHILLFLALLPWLVLQLITMKTSRRVKLAVGIGGVVFILGALFLNDRMTSSVFYKSKSIGADYAAPIAQAVPAPASRGAISDRYDQALDGSRQQALRERSNEMDMLELKKSEGATLGQAGAGFMPPQQMAFQEIDPRAVVQTGPGVPRVNGPTIELRWSNKVPSDESVKVIYLSPVISGLLNLCGVIGTLFVWLKAYKRVRQASWSVLLVLFVLVGNVRAQEFPSKELLTELQERIVNARCTQDCVAIDSAKLHLDSGRILIDMRVSSQGVGAVALPGPLSEMVISDVKIGANQSVALLRTEDDVVYARIPDGISQLQVSAAFVDPNEAAITFSQPPHYVAVEAAGWQIDGLSPEGMVRGTLHLVRNGSDNSSQALDGAKRTGSKLPEWFTVERSLRIGLNWLSTTTVTRSGNDADAAASVHIPLLAGESVLTPGLNVADGKVEIPFAYGQNTYSFESKMSQNESLSLKATALANTTEVWNLTCSTIWQCSASGLNPIYSQVSGMQAWRWRPFPNEDVKLTFAKPLGVEGQTTTVDSVAFEISPQARSSEVMIRATVRESQSGLFAIQLPAEITVEKLSVAGAAQVLRREGDKLLVNLPAGSSQIELKGQSSQGWQALFTTPPIKFGDSAVNLSTKITESSARWNVLAGGEGAGPVALWWGKLALLASFVLVLARARTLDLSILQAVVLSFGLAILPIELAVWPFLFFALLSFRASHAIERWWLFNSLQIAVVLVGLIAATAFWRSAAIGLSRAPNMLFLSSNFDPSALMWSLQHSAGNPPTAWLISFPLAVWQGIFVLWLIAAAAILLKKRSWFVASFSKNGVWK